MNKNKLVILIACAFLVLGIGILWSNMQSEATKTQAAADAQQRAKDVAQIKAIIKQRQQAWAEHLKRKAWDDAHPQEVAQRKAAAAEKLREQQAAQAQEEARHTQEEARQEKEDHPCQTADSLERKAADQINAESYQETYDTVVSGIHYNDECDTESDQTINSGFFLSFKAVAEHELGTGDWRTDFNQANQQLVECQTMPGVYGTHLAGVCESQEQNNISRQTNWEMNE